MDFLLFYLSMRKSVNAGLLMIGIVLLVTACKKKTDPPKSSDAYINSFTLRVTENPSFAHSIEARVSYDSIILSLKPGTDVTNLIPYIEFTGGSVNPGSGTAQNFSNTVLYTVTAQNGNKKTYKAIVRYLSSSKDITSFVLNKADNPSLNSDLNGIISGDSITINLPVGVSASSLVPTITHNGASITPASHQATDFSISPTYTVTAEDGTVHNYKVFIGSNSSIYVNGDDGYLYSINAVNGAVQWKFNSGTVSAVPTYYNGTVFVSGANNVIYAVNASNGTLKWTSTPPGGNYSLTMPAVSGGKIYYAGSGYLNDALNQYATYKGFVYALNTETGNQEWLSTLTLDSFYTYSDSRITNVTVKDNIVCIYDIMNGLFVYNATDGSSLWTDVGDMLGRENPVLFNNTVYFGIEGGMRAMQADNGTPIWRLFGTSNNLVVFYSPTIYNNLMYTVDTKANLYSIDLNGSIRWTLNLGVNSPSYSPPFVSNNLIYLFSSSNDLSAYTTDNGTFKWKKTGLYGQPIVANNAIYITDVNKQLNCMDAATGNIKWTSPLQHFSQPFCVVDGNGTAYHITDSGEQQ